LKNRNTYKNVLLSAQARLWSYALPSLSSQTFPPSAFPGYFFLNFSSSIAVFFRDLSLAREEVDEDDGSWWLLDEVGASVEAGEVELELRRADTGKGRPDSAWPPSFPPGRWAFFSSPPSVSDDDSPLDVALESSAERTPSTDKFRSWRKRGRRSSIVRA
jgi:hypothetical protein